MQYKVLSEKETNPTYRKVLEAERVLDELGITLEAAGNTMIVCVDGKSFALYDRESCDDVMNFPRMFDGIALRLLEEECDTE